MTARGVYQLALAGALGGWLGHDLYGQVAPGGPSFLEGGMVGASVGLLLGLAVGWRAERGRLTLLAAMGSLAGALGGALARGGTSLLPRFPEALAVVLAGTIVGAAIGAALTGSRSGPIASTLGGLVGGVLAAGLGWLCSGPRVAGLSVEGLGAAVLGASIGLALSLAALLGDNRSVVPLQGPSP
jgi:hypothetical protein